MQLYIMANICLNISVRPEYMSIACIHFNIRTCSTLLIETYKNEHDDCMMAWKNTKYVTAQSTYINVVNEQKCPETDSEKLYTVTKKLS